MSESQILVCAPDLIGQRVEYEEDKETFKGTIKAVACDVRTQGWPLT